MGLTVLAKETSIVLLGGVSAFLALTPGCRVRLRDLASRSGVMALVIAPFPLALALGGRSGTGESYLAWQLFRRPNHAWVFYAVDGAAGDRPAGRRRGRRRARGCCGGSGSWRERLLLCWIAVPVAVLRALAGQGLPVPAAVAAPAVAGAAPARAAESRSQADAAGRLGARRLVAWPRLAGAALDAIVELRRAAQLARRRRRAARAAARPAAGSTRTCPRARR